VLSYTSRDNTRHKSQVSQDQVSQDQVSQDQVSSDLWHWSATIKNLELDRHHGEIEHLDSGPYFVVGDENCLDILLHLLHALAGPVEHIHFSTGMFRVTGPHA
jgi:hypothetical protein